MSKPSIGPDLGHKFVPDSGHSPVQWPSSGTEWPRLRPISSFILSFQKYEQNTLEKDLLLIYKDLQPLMAMHSEKAARLLEVGQTQ